MFGIPEPIHHITDIFYLMRRDRRLCLVAVVRCSHHMQVVIIGLDRSMDEHKAARKSMPSSEHVTWLHAVAEQQLREDLRLRSLPAFYLLNGDTLARSPAPVPSKGLGELFFKAKAEAEKGQRVKVWDD